MWHCPQVCADHSLRTFQAPVARRTNLCNELQTGTSLGGRRYQILGICCGISHCRVRCEPWWMAGLEKVIQGTLHHIHGTQTAIIWYKSGAWGSGSTYTARGPMMRACKEVFSRCIDDSHPAGIGMRVEWPISNAASPPTSELKSRAQSMLQ